jgi:hypothetical protein
MGQRYRMSSDKLFKLNPNLARDCSNVQPSTDYYVRGCKCLPIYSFTPREKGLENERL